MRKKFVALIVVLAFFADILPPFCRSKNGARNAKLAVLFAAIFEQKYDVIALWNRSAREDFVCLCAFERNL